MDGGAQEKMVEATAPAQTAGLKEDVRRWASSVAESGAAVAQHLLGMQRAMGSTPGISSKKGSGSC